MARFSADYVLFKYKSGDTASVLEITDKIFALLHLNSFWTNLETSPKCVSFAMVLASGLNAETLCTCVWEGGRELDLVKWVLPLTDVTLLYRKLLLAKEKAMEKYNLKYLGFEKALIALRERITDRVESTACMALSFIVGDTLGNVQLWAGMKTHVSYTWI